MASRRKPRGKRINPTYFVFCEGESEEEYIRFLRSVYRIPIEINSKRTGDRISQRFINGYLKTKTKHKKDEIFLMFDLDVEGTLEKLNELNGILLTSNPCLELWFVLHHREQRAHISTTNCIRTLQEIWPNYEKGRLEENQKRELLEFLVLATERSNQLQPHANPSTTVNEFIRYLENAKRSKNES
ncbi:MAG: RloB family protein [Cyclobacteriaceae bacterium]